MLNKAKTVRCFLIYNNSILFLRKALSSRNPNKLELPGGKVDDDESLEEAMYKEIFEETNIKIDISKLLELPELFKTYRFSSRGEDYFREVSFFLYRLTDLPEVKVNTHIGDDGLPEDHHEKSEWITIEEYFQKILEGENTEFSENSIVELSEETELKFR